MEPTTSEEIEELNRKPVTDDLLFYVTLQVYSAVPKYKKELPHAHSALLTASNKLCSQLPSLSSFVALVVHRSRVKAGTLLGSLVFLTRMIKILPATARGLPCTSYRIFLACLILSSKTLNDISPKNSSWCRQAIYFTLGEINLMEKQLLKLLGYRTWIQPKEFIETYDRFHLFDIHLLIRQASCASEIKQYYQKQDTLYLNPSTSFGSSQDSFQTDQDLLKPSCPDSLFSLKEFAGHSSDLGKENMITIISDTL